MRLDITPFSVNRVIKQQIEIVGGKLTYIKDLYTRRDFLFPNNLAQLNRSHFDRLTLKKLFNGLKAKLSCGYGSQKGQNSKGKGSISHYFKRPIDQVDSDQDAVNQKHESKSPRLDTEALSVGDIVSPKDDELQCSTLPCLPCTDVPSKRFPPGYRVRGTRYRRRG